MGEWEARSFQNSLETLVQIALHETGTQDYAFLREAPSPARRILLAGGGAVAVHQITQVDCVSWRINFAARSCCRDKSAEPNRHSLAQLVLVTRRARMGGAPQ